VYKIYLNQKQIPATKPKNRKTNVGKHEMGSNDDKSVHFYTSQGTDKFTENLENTTSDKSLIDDSDVQILSSSDYDESEISSTTKLTRQSIIDKIKSNAMF